jgi:hypothetical protein
MRDMQCNVEFGYQLNICSKDRGKPRKTLIGLAGRTTFRKRSNFWYLNTRVLTAVPSALLLYFLNISTD